MGIGVGAWLEERNEIEKGERHRVAGVVQAACLAHDIGNPPFGHSGEDAIGQWFKYKIAEKKGIFLDLPVEFHEELSNFEGNAQGFRIINQLEMYRNDGGMRLSKSVIASFVKYPVTAEMRGNFINSQEYCGLKKFGFSNLSLRYLRRCSHLLKFHVYLKREISIGVGIPWRSLWRPLMIYVTKYLMLRMDLLRVILVMIRFLICCSRWPVLRIFVKST